MKVLIVEDDGLMAQTIAALLGQKKFNATIVSDGRSALEMMELYPFDAVLLDLRLKQESGLDVLREARRKGLTYPILILSGDMEISTKVAALGAGADDYITKPFKIDELSARILAVVRRTNGHINTKVTIGELVIDLDARTATAQGKLLTLTSKEYDILETLALRKGRTLSKDMLMSQLYGGVDEPSIKIIDVFICKLRKKLCDALDGNCPIQTVWGRGYMMKDPSDTSIQEDFALSA
ncbi:MAG: response regulator transcription factor [Rhodobacteraceae bacterium]|nr:response regulator transcription factor [Paracoccaceae bacterium]